MVSIKNLKNNQNSHKKYRNSHFRWKNGYFAVKIDIFESELMIFAQNGHFSEYNFPKTIIFERKKLVSRNLIIISVYIIIVTLLHIATDFWFQLISIKAQLLETAWSCLTCLYIMNITNIYCNLYVETYVGSQHVNILKRYLLDNNIQNLRLSSYFWNSWLDKSYSRRVASKLTFFLKNYNFIGKPAFTRNWYFRAKFYLEHVASENPTFCAN